MCGFLGQFNTKNLPESEFKELLSLSVHRGPDQTGYWESERVQFGFNRLAILDLTDAGYQPMKSPNGQFVVLFNGEIYNHVALRKKLPKYNYKGHSDSETITHALEIWGIQKTIEHLDGMFALAIYHNACKELILARDFAGIKPLFFGNENGQIVFGSQYDQVKTHPLFREKSISPQVLKLYLKQHFIPAPFGLYSGTHQLRPGEIVTFSQNGKIKKQRYWELPNTLSSELIKDDQTAQNVLSHAFESSVDDQMIADVPLGAFLSGGVDSPLICSYAKRFHSDIEVFSIGSDSKKHDESERAKVFAKSIKLNQHLWKLNGSEMMSYWEQASASLHEPMADFSILPTYLVSKLARKQVSVALSGDGGDELFFGYERFWSVAQNMRLYKYPQNLRKVIYGVDKAIFNNRHVNSLITLKNQAGAHESLHSRFNNTLLNRIVPDLQSINLPDEWDIYSYENTNDLRQLMANMRKAEFYGMMQKTLRKVDLASMQNSLEVRVPFLSKRVIEASLNIDPLISVKDHGRKKVLKSLLKSRIPQVIDDGIKRGFTFPLRSWISTNLKPKFEAMAEELPSKFDLFQKTEIQKMLNSHISDEKDLKWPLFTLYALNKYES